MSFYKLEASYPYTTLYGDKKRKIYKYWYNSVDTLIHQVKYDLSLGAKVAVKEISESEYIRGLKR